MSVRIRPASSGPFRTCRQHASSDGVAMQGPDSGCSCMYNPKTPSTLHQTTAVRHKKAAESVTKFDPALVRRVQHSPDSCGSRTSKKSNPKDGLTIELSRLSNSECSLCDYVQIVSELIPDMVNMGMPEQGKDIFVSTFS